MHIRFKYLQFQDVIRLGGSGILKHYDGSLSNLLSLNYPEYDWLPWRFAQLQKNFWTINHQKNFIKWAERELKITNMSDWYKITTRVMCQTFYICNETRTFKTLGAEEFLNSINFLY